MHPSQFKNAFYKMFSVTLTCKSMTFSMPSVSSVLASDWMWPLY